MTDPYFSQRKWFTDREVVMLNKCKLVVLFCEYRFSTVEALLATTLVSDQL